MSQPRRPATPPTPSRANKQQKTLHWPAESKHVSCPVHKLVELDPLVQAFMNSPEMERLRDLKQLGTTSQVYPSAVHTRFAHSIGVAHMARDLCRRLATHPMPAGVEPPSAQDVLCVTIAALCHDIGHGPFSHAFDDYLKRALPKYTKMKEHKHEDMSKRLLKRLLKRLDSEMRRYGLDPEADGLFIEELISSSGIGERRGRPWAKWYLYDIVSNADSGLDVDKLDYLLRDTKQVCLERMAADRSPAPPTGRGAIVSCTQCVRNRSRAPAAEADSEPATEADPSCSTRGRSSRTGVRTSSRTTCCRTRACASRASLTRRRRGPSSPSRRRRAPTAR